jgi:8-oxo-dGTP pyrophosphatase MutT (NUDIX family)
MKTGERHEQTLLRELREETGFNLKHITRLAGIALEYDRVREKNYDVFKMHSYYYLCRIKDEVNMPDLDPYEADLGFTTVWVNCNDALENNQQLMATDNPDNPRWLERETAVLSILKSVIG